ncbi:hypothetical protein H4N34_000669 [Staphylococcus pseudintermedius]|nr:hypothetical protein [Staphylococcus pseudintermedius]
MNKYIIKDGVIAYKGNIYRKGDLIELEDKYAQSLKPYLDMSKSNQIDLSQYGDINDLKVSDLQKIVDEFSIEVIPTGKTGPIRSDYLKALDSYKI